MDTKDGAMQSDAPVTSKLDFSQEVTQPAPVTAAPAETVDASVDAGENVADVIEPAKAPAATKATGLKRAPAAVAAENSAEELKDLQAQRDALDKQINDRKAAEQKAVIAQIVGVVKTYSVDVHELVDALGGLPNKRKGIPAPIKYRDPATGNQWSGRGKAPGWLADKNREDYLVKD